MCSSDLTSLGVRAEHTQNTLVAVGLQVDAPREGLVPQHGQHVVAVSTLRRWCVDLDAIVETEQPLVACTEPAHRVERAEHRRCGDPPGNGGFVMKVGGFVPTLHLYLAHRSFIDQFTNERLAASEPLPVVVGEVGERADALVTRPNSSHFESITPQLTSERTARTTSTTLVATVALRISSSGVLGIALVICLNGISVVGSGVRQLVR